MENQIDLRIFWKHCELDVNWISYEGMKQLGSLVIVHI